MSVWILFPSPRRELCYKGQMLQDIGNTDRFFSSCTRCCRRLLLSWSSCSLSSDPCRWSSSRPVSSSKSSRNSGVAGFLLGCTVSCSSAASRPHSVSISPASAPSSPLPSSSSVLAASSLVVLACGDSFLFACANSFAWMRMCASTSSAHQRHV